MKQADGPCADATSSRGPRWPSDERGTPNVGSLESLLHEAVNVSGVPSKNRFFEKSTEASCLAIGREPYSHFVALAILVPLSTLQLTDERATSPHHYREFLGSVH